MQMHDNVRENLGLNIPGKSRKAKWRRLLLIAVMLLLIVLGVYAFTGSEEKGPAYKTEPAERSDMTVTVTAVGNLQPVKEVEVGSEISGIIKTVEADFNDRVEEGQVLARMDDTKLKAEVEQRRAALSAARAGLLDAQATVKENYLDLKRLQDVQEYSDVAAVSQNDIDKAQAALDRAHADRAAAEARIEEAQAALHSVETNLSKTVIYSPISGVVLNRNIEPGQTVAASLQAPVLFTLAEDLAKMELHVDVDEADVGLVHEGQQASFRVDAYPDRTYPARIALVRYGAQTVNNVVTYKTVLDANNDDLSLRPGMTATAEIIVEKITAAVLIPNRALGFRPQDDTSKDKRSFMSTLLRRRPRRERSKPNNTDGNGMKSVYVLEDGRPVELKVRTGATDGKQTVLLQGGIEPGTELIIGEVVRK